MAMNPPAAATASSRWHSPLLLACCMDMEVCIYVCCCRPCAYGETIDAIQGGGCCFPCLFLCFAQNCAACCQAGPARGTMRAKLGGIEPDLCGDCMVAFFCMDCMLCQMKRELKHRSLSGSACVDEYYVKSRVDAATRTVAPGIPVMEERK